VKAGPDTDIPESSAPETLRLRSDEEAPETLRLVGPAGAGRIAPETLKTAPDAAAGGPLRHGEADLMGEGRLGDC